MFLRLLVLAYGVAGYALFLATFVYSVGFIGGFLTPTRLDGERWEALTLDLAWKEGDL